MTTPNQNSQRPQPPIPGPQQQGQQGQPQVPGPGYPHQVPQQPVMPGQPGAVQQPGTPIAGYPNQPPGPQPPLTPQAPTPGQIPVAQIPGQFPTGQVVPGAPAVPPQPAAPQTFQQPATPNQPVMPNQPAVPQAHLPNQPVVPNRPIAPTQNTAPQPVIPNQAPVVPARGQPPQPLTPNQPTTPSRPLTPVKPNNPPAAQKPAGASPVPTTSRQQHSKPKAAPVQVTDPRQLQAPTKATAANKPQKSVKAADARSSGAGPQAKTPNQSQKGSKPQPQSSAPSTPQPVNPAARKNQQAGSPAANRPLQPNRPQPLDKSRPIPVEKPTSAVQTHDEEDFQEEVAQKIVRSVPSWLVSAVIHMVLLIILGILSRPYFKEEPIDIEMAEYAEEVGEQLIDDSLELEADSPDDVSEEIISFDVVEVENPLAATVDLATVLDSLNEVDQIEAPSIGHALSGREKGAKKGLLGKYGGTASTEAAVLRGLEWLKRNQLKDGSWSLLGPYSGFSANVENKTAATAMALLAFQGAGHTHKSGEFRQTVAKGLSALLKLQTRDGDFAAGDDPRQSLYSHAQATIVLCELYGMTKDEKYLGPAQRAVDFCVDAQSAEGGWKYRPGIDADMSVTGWFVMALQSALMAELKVPPKTLENITTFIDSVAHQNGTRYGYMAIGYEPTLTLTAEALLCRQYLGWSRDDPRLVNGVQYINQNLIPTTDAGWEQKQNVYYWYYATQLTHHMEGEYWDRWNKVMRQQIPARQVAKGKEKGSWDNTYDTWGVKAGRLYTTCLCIYMLEVYYRHLPIYRYRGK